jgi:hypothetical protein
MNDDGVWVNHDGSIHSHPRPCKFGCGKMVTYNAELDREDDVGRSSEHRCPQGLEYYRKRRVRQSVRIDIDVNLDGFLDRDETGATKTDSLRS